MRLALSDFVYEDRCRLKSIIAISIGAGPGPVLRWWLGLTLNSHFPSAPPGTLAAKPTTRCAIRFEELGAIWTLVGEAKALLDSKFHPDGYNLGVNVGEVAGQIIAHARVHLIPRYHGDVENPHGGVRGVIPAKQRYELETHGSKRTAQP